MQDDIFSGSEADAWYGRNSKALHAFDSGSDLVMSLVDLYGIQPSSILEIGAANGVRVAALVDRFGAHGVALEPSTEAIADGRRSYPDVRFVQGVAHSIPIDDAFDIVIVHFVLHWIDRDMLLRSVSEIDRMVTPGGFLAVGDFAPQHRMKVPYHHRDDVELYTFKQQYDELFIASGLYRRVATLTTSHQRGASANLAPHVSDDECVAVTLLRKDRDAAYIERQFGGTRNVE